ncbi:unnamed protein product [Eruca vesicaria subsp. sativa]|uniref:TFIIS N-terminal domain-containing protein n=1 Tax=Eruca vesicaria subsp. sativa TaxID=29727 RepID=A0ABC8IN19_ERUVS|nr:unnamed protein product [Eruca vesicaria subsp. sativa]
MTTEKPSASLDTWRDYFRRGDSDIFGIIEHAIMVAAADLPKEFKARRDTITELLFSCQVGRCIGCGQRELSKAVHEEANSDRKSVETVGVDSGGHEEDETKLNVDEIVDEVMRIKYILLNKNNEPYVLVESLTNLASISMSVDLIKETKIGKVVNGLRKHGSYKIKKLAKTLIVKWKAMVDQWSNMPKEGAGNSSISSCNLFATLSIVDEAESFPSLPHDLVLYAREPTALEISKMFSDLLDSHVQPKHERKVQSRMIRKLDGTCEANVVGRDKKNQQMRREEFDVRPMRHSAPVLDEPIRKSKQNKGEMVRAIQRIDGSQQDTHKALDQEAKFENTKKRIQESYQQHENAKRQRTIQVLETIPEQRKAQRPLLKIRPMRR